MMNSTLDRAYAYPYASRTPAGRLELMASDTVFQAEAGAARIQLLGPLEAAGAEYDALGRVRSGLARRNLAIPRYKLTRNGALRFDASKLGHFRFRY